MSPYIISPAAQRDLHDIAYYTSKKWSAAQARRYTAALKRGMLSLAAGRIIYKEIGHFRIPLRMAHIEHHYVFAFIEENAPALVAAIYHERSNYMEHLFNRFQPKFISSGGEQI